MKGKKPFILSTKKRNTLFDIAQELYAEELKKSGMASLPYAWIQNNLTGEYLIYTPYSKIADKIKDAIKKIDFDKEE